MNLKINILGIFKKAILKYFSPFIFLFILFKKKPVLPQRTQQEIDNDKFRDKYRIVPINNRQYIQYLFNGEWWYLRNWDEDYVLEESPTNAISITLLLYLEDIITYHQIWLQQGKIFLPFR